MIISRTPMRMSFAGGGTDLREYYKLGYGAVLSTTLNKFVYITVNNRFTPKIRVSYSQIEEVNSIDKIEHNLVREAAKKTGIGPGTDIVYMSDMMPAHEGSGLGASSSITVGTLNALYANHGKHVSAEKLAKEACDIEIEILKNPIGKQDQYAAAYGGFNFIKFNADETVEVQPVILTNGLKEELNGNLLFFHTGVNTRSDIVLTEQRKNMGINKYILDKMVSQAEKLRDSLRSSDLTEFGSILHQGWQFKQKLASNMTNDLINSYYEKAIKAGAVGGKILGSGGGGFLLFYCDKKNQGKVRKALSYLKEADFKFNPYGSRIIYVGD